MLLDFFRKPKPPVEEDLQAIIASHPNGLIVMQLNQPLQSIFLSAEEATAVAKALLVEARRVKIRSASVFKPEAKESYS
jgi:hypothetical protein